MRQAIGPQVQFAVVERAFAVDHCRRPRSLGGLALDQAVQTGSRGEVLRTGVPLQQVGTRFGLVQKFQLGDARLRPGYDRLEQVQPVAGDALGARRVEEIGGIGQFGKQAIGGFVGIQGQVELRGLHVPGQVLDLEFAQGSETRTAMIVALVVVHHLEQRRMAETAFRLQRIHQLLERQVLMTLRFHHRPPDLP